MRFLLVLALATVSLAGTVLPNQNGIGHSMFEQTDAFASALKETDGELVLDFSEENGFNKYPMQRGGILSWKVKRLLYKMQKEMPCGWPQFGIPPLAPLMVPEAKISLVRDILQTFNKVFRLLIVGLDNWKIQKLNLNAVKRYVQFDILFHNIVISADKYETNTTLAAMQQLGLHLQYEGVGSLKFALQNVRLTGTMKYKLPLIYGSAKIKSLKTDFTIENFTSDITGLLGGGEAINNLINRQLESFVGTRNNNQKINDLIEDILVPEVNNKLKGKDFWTLIDSIFSSDESEDDQIVSKCVPPTDTWA